MFSFYYELHFNSTFATIIILIIQLLNNNRITLLHAVLEHESFFLNLLNTLDQMKTNHDFNTRHANTFNSIVCNTNKCLHSFLIRTARDLRVGENAVDY